MVKSRNIPALFLFDKIYFYKMKKKILKILFTTKKRCDIFSLNRNDFYLMKINEGREKEKPQKGLICKTKIGIQALLIFEEQFVESLRYIPAVNRG